ncbi:hypothetical protein [Rhodococcus sp. 14-2470-1a]|uniref:hypothetical protein n=1 Tax=Rhodococcus sp. 14-2470-1a TaxID=2023150 RepID=UPI000B9BDB7F|nr:hypothetical protein [Rhodococcus sp. 14-2470-1a]OZF55504.1 hypothetical protein CH292_05995 [Rhodococcus sp. 14-2470-1a]
MTGLEIAVAVVTIVGYVATAIGVIVALFAALVIEPKRARTDRDQRDDLAREDRERYEAQMATLLRAEKDRIAAQARKVIVGIDTNRLLGEDVFFVRAVNHSTAPIGEVSVRVHAVDSDGNEVADGCEQANRSLGADVNVSKIVADVLSETMAKQMRKSPMGGIGAMGGLQGFQQQHLQNQMRGTIQSTLGPPLQSVVNDALQGLLTDEWRSTLSPSQMAIMGYHKTAGVRLAAEISFTDEAGYRWVRDDRGVPRQVGGPDA